MDILRASSTDLAPVELWQLQPGCTFVPEFQVKDLGISVGSADLWYLTSHADTDNLTVVNLNTGGVFSFRRSSLVIPAPSVLQRV
jgi:hypothetical protein